VRHPAPKRFYLALGDSIAYGIQPAKVTAGLPPSGFRTGYVDVFAKRLRTLAPRLQVVNYSCPGESTKTFVSGLCPWTLNAQKLHDEHKGSQLGAALAFLRAHRGQVSPITLTLWSNDITELSNACNDNLACVKARAPRALGQFAARLGSILKKLRAAAPSAVVVVTGAWNNDVLHLETTDPLYRSLDVAMKRVSAGVRARYAELFPTFNPTGGVAREKARVCALTFICSSADGHPTDAGYRAIAAAVWAASGF
jgi:lysophospholipase L1-like esterase